MKTETDRYLISIENLGEKSSQPDFEGIEKLEATDAPTVEWVLNCRGWTKKEKSLWQKLILQNARSIPPVLLSLDMPPLLYLGVDEVIFILDLPTGELLARYDLGTPIVWFHLTDNSLIFAVCELEVYAFTPHGSLKWTSNFPDVIKDVIHRGECLEVVDLSDQVYQLDVLTGNFCA
jgi:hypothetical protein